MKLHKNTIEAMYACGWGIHHLFGRFYLVKKWSRPTKGIRGLIWCIDWSDEE